MFPEHLYNREDRYDFKFLKIKSIDSPEFYGTPEEQRKQKEKAAIAERRKKAFNKIFKRKS